ncbi:ABC transporter ATP-binding protein [Clostridium tyrobutyricum]|uniref:ABC transporter ATP-binding protein n=1 Tax=Clostridium tyrobutyricum TaxID=1519 RepID=UPI00057E2363|nr:ATP-binding cassette domain-containing protein [Clostridium tyrobutyricum]
MEYSGNIIIKNLFKSYNQNSVFHDFNIEFQNHKINIVLGTSGCGKTTLLNIIAGIDKDYKGQVVVDRNSISYMFQEDRLLPNKTVLENIIFVLKSHMKKEQFENIANKYVKIMELEKFKYKFPYELSGGMKRRVALGRTIAYNNNLILMDEPFKGLDDRLKDRIMDEVLKIHEDRNNTMIIVTHDKHEAYKLGDIIYSLD